MSNCYMCNQPLTKENQSEEHVLLNSLGGHLTSKRLLCKKCNSKFGSGADAELSSQLNFYATILMIKRDSGEPPSIIMERPSDGRKYRISADGTPQIKDPFVIQKKGEDEVSITIEARDEKEARRILEGLSRKYKNLNAETLLSRAQHEEEQIAEPLHFQMIVGGEKALPSVLKTAINYYIETCEDTENIREAISSLRAGVPGRVEPIILERRTFDLRDGEVSHSIYLYGRRGEKLYAIVEYFNSVQFIVRLSDQYTGPDIESLYVFDVLERTELKKSIAHRLDLDFVATFRYPTSKPNFKIMQDAAARVVSIAMKRQHEKRQADIIQSAWDKTIAKMVPDGEPITREAIDSFSNQLGADLERYLRTLFPNRKE